ncbi:MAG: helix-turn-helix transcriptional regulator [Planctomycetota bacterium]
MPEDFIQRLAFRHSAGRRSPVDVIRLSRLRARELDHSMHDPTRLAFHLVQFVLSGEGAHRVDFERVELRPGDVLHVRPEQVHAFDPEVDHEALVLMFTPRALEEAHIPQSARWQASTVLRPAPDDFRILTELLRVQEALDTESSELRAGSVGPHLLATILAGLADVVSAHQGSLDLAAQRYEELVLEFEALLDRHHASSRTQAWYAEQLGTTPRTLARACRVARATSPKRKIDLRVVLEAKRLLATTPETVEAIGYRLGFSEPTNFVKFFRRIVGSPPDAFRHEQARGGL